MRSLTGGIPYGNPTGVPDGKAGGGSGGLDPDDNSDGIPDVGLGHFLIPEPYFCQWELPRPPNLLYKPAPPLLKI
jgi:hypothetical protein